MAKVSITQPNSGGTDWELKFLFKDAVIHIEREEHKNNMESEGLSSKGPVYDWPEEWQNKWKMISECKSPNFDSNYQIIKSKKEAQFDFFLKQNNEIISRFPDDSFKISDESIYFNSRITEIDSGFPNIMSYLFASNVTANYPVRDDWLNCSPKEMSLKVPTLGLNPDNFFPPEFYKNIYDIFISDEDLFMEADVDGSKIAKPMIAQIYFERDGLVWVLDEIEEEDW